MKDCRYEEAMERARELHEAGNALTKSQMEIVFPELKESEDEKITAEIVDFISRNADRGDDIMKSAGWIAYLEKQKEQKPVKLNDDTEVGLDRALQIVKAAKGNLCGYQSDDGIYECCHAIQTLERILKNGIEQKPAEWTIDDAKPGDILNSTRVQATIIYKGKADDGKHILAYCALQKGIFISQEMLWDRDFELASEYWKNALYEAMVRKGYDWDADELELKKKEGNSAEYSEEDDAFRDLLICILKTEHPNGVFTMSAEHMSALKCTVMPVDRIIDWLRSLRPQPKQEWSEGIKKQLDEISDYLKYKGREEDADFIRHLRPQPHWKPSKEQMEALNAINCNGGLSYVGQQEHLISLYNDIKKL